MLTTLVQGAGVRLATRVALGWLELPVELVVRLQHIRSHLYLYMPGDFSDKFSFMFEKFPWDRCAFETLHAARFGMRIWP